MARWELLHITDIHYKDTYSDTAKISVPCGFRENVKHVLASCLNAFLPNGNGLSALSLPDAVLLTGDLTDRGDPVGLRALHDDWGPFLRAAAIDRVVAAVPGNHDVKWKVPSNATNLFDEKFAAFNQFLDGLPLDTCAIPTGGLSGDVIGFRKNLPSPVAVDERRRLVVICINSAMRCGELNVALVEEAKVLIKAIKPAADIQALTNWIEGRCLHDIAQVTLAQRSLLEQELQRTRERLGESWWNSSLRIAILHHHLVGFPGPIEHKEFESTIDAPQVLELLAQFGVQLILTGHKHQPYDTHQVVRVDGREHHMVVAGGATVLGGGTDVRPSFNLVEIDLSANGAMAVHFRAVPVDQGANAFVTRWKKRERDETRVIRLPATVIMPGMDAGSLPVDEPGFLVPIDKKSVRAHEAARIYSGVELGEYCYYCKTLAEQSEGFLFTLLTIDPADLVRDLCGGNWPRDTAEFLAITDAKNLHFKTFREHKNGVRLVVAHDQSSWIEKNRKAFGFLEALNGNMRCYVVQRSALASMGGVLLADHTAVATRICMYDREALMMTTGQIDLMHEGGLYSRLVDPKNVDEQIFVRFDVFKKANELDGGVP